MTQFAAHRRDGKIVLEIDEAAFLRDAVSTATGGELSVTAREQFLRFATENVFTLTHDVAEDIDQRASWWLRLTQALGKAAAATQHGVVRAEEAHPTCGCDPEEHDGG